MDLEIRLDSGGATMADTDDRAQTFMLEHTRRAGEWMLLPISEITAEASVEQILSKLMGPAKLLRKLQQQDEAQIVGSRLRLRLFPTEVIDFVPNYGEPLDVLYEDDFCLVVSKRAGLPVHPHAPQQTNTLANVLAAHYEATGQYCRIRHIHRLDKDTTGPVLYAKNEWAQLVLDEAMRHKQIQRQYVAVVQGLMRDNHGTINAPIGRDRHHAQRRRVSPTGESAVTHYEVLERYAQHTLIRLQLETGRTHQIRVHLASIGHPLVGDMLYGGDQTWIDRQALHGCTLAFAHPWSSKFTSIEAPWPNDFAQLTQKLATSRPKM